MFAPLSIGFIVILFLESKRAPFDHAETESEVVNGYATEYNGGMLLMFFLSEYLHLAIASLHFILFFIGGWNVCEVFFFLPIVFMGYHDTMFYSYSFLYNFTITS